MNKYALSMSGGAARGAFSLGCLQYFDDHGIEIDVIAGSSIGAIVGASYACGNKPKDILDMFMSKDLKKIIRFNFFKNSIFRIKEDAPILKKIIPIENLEDFPKKITVTSVDVKSGELLYFDKGNAIKAVLASSAFAPIFKPIEYDGKLLVDGGVKDHLPMEPLKNCGLPIIAINHFPLKEKNNLSFFNIFFRMVYLSWHHSFEDSINKSDIYITCEDLADVSVASFKDMKKAFLLGYKECEKIFNK